MTLEGFAALVKDMRESQRTYFRWRKEEDLLKARALESRVDAELRAFSRPPERSLFDSSPAEENE